MSGDLYKYKVGDKVLIRKVEDRFSPKKLYMRSGPGANVTHVTEYNLDNTGIAGKTTVVVGIQWDAYYTMNSDNEMVFFTDDCIVSNASPNSIPLLL